MQFRILLAKDLKALFKQKAVIFTLLIPTILIISLGILPSVLGVNQPLKVGYLNEDRGIDNLNLGQTVIAQLKQALADQANIKLTMLKSPKDLASIDNAIWLPANFSQVANQSSHAVYFIKYSDSDIRADSVMNSVISSQIETSVREALLKTKLPSVDTERIYTETQTTGSQGVHQNQAALAFPLAYMAFLILILSSSSMRISGFSSEREAGMMELLLSSVIDRREMVMSKLITGVIYGLASVLSYGLGILILFLLQGNSSPSQLSAVLVISPELITPRSFITIFFLFADLSFLAIEILLSAQLLLGKEAGDRLGSMGLMILSFLFYFGTLGDPLSQSTAQIMNPFFWPFRLALNAIFGIQLYNSLLLIVMNVTFAWYLLRLMTNAIEREKVIFE